MPRRGWQTQSKIRQWEEDLRRSTTPQPVRKSAKLDWEVVNKLYEDEEENARSGDENSCSDKSNIATTNTTHTTTTSNDMSKDKDTTAKMSIIGDRNTVPIKESANIVNHESAIEEAESRIEQFKEEWYANVFSKSSLNYITSLKNAMTVPDWDVIRAFNLINKIKPGAAKSIKRAEADATTDPPDDPLLFKSLTPAQARGLLKAMALKRTRHARLQGLGTVNKAEQRLSDGTLFVPYSPREVFAKMLNWMRRKNFERYAHMLSKEDDDLFTQLQRCFPENVWTILEERDYSVEKLLLINEPQPDRGVYLHILWSVLSDPRLYVGQSIDLPLRISCHEDPGYRLLNPSLHYFWRDQWRLDQLESRYVYLCDLSNQEFVDPQILNMLEMFVSLIFQTLPRDVLIDCLSADNLSPTAGCHLNVNLPLHQSARNEELHGNAYLSEDPIIKEYYRELRLRFHGLKDSTDQAHRNYYESVMRIREEKNFIARNKITRIQAQTGRFLPIQSSKARTCYAVHLWDLNINIPSNLGPIEPKSLIWVKCELSQPSEEHAHKYARRSGESDPARRFAIWIKGINSDGIGFERFLKTEGKQKVFLANTVVDFIQGESMRTIIKLPRRFIRRRFQRRHPELLPIKGLVHGYRTPNEMPPFDINDLSESLSDVSSDRELTDDDGLERKS